MKRNFFVLCLACVLFLASCRVRIDETITGDVKNEQKEVNVDFSPEFSDNNDVACRMTEEVEKPLFSMYYYENKHNETWKFFPYKQQNMDFFTNKL